MVFGVEAQTCNTYNNIEDKVADTTMRWPKYHLLLTMSLCR